MHILTGNTHGVYRACNFIGKSDKVAGVPCTIALIQVCQISCENEVCAVKWRNFYNKVIVTDMELIFCQLISDDKVKLV